MVIGCALHGTSDVVRCGLEVVLRPYGDRVRIVERGQADVHLLDMVSGRVAHAPLAALNGPVVGLTADTGAEVRRHAEALGVARVVRLGDAGLRLVWVLEEVHEGTAAPVQRVRPQPSGLASPLSERELDVLAAICRGMTNDQIAGHLFVSVNSVKTYIRTAYRKIGVASRTQALLWSLDHGL